MDALVSPFAVALYGALFGVGLVGAWLFLPLWRRRGGGAR